MRTRGKIEALIVGPMSCGKTDKLIRTLRTKERHGQEKLRWIAFKPSKDIRSRLGMIESKPDGDQKGDSIDAFEIPTDGDGPWEIFNYVKQEEARIGTISLVVVDEVNFFKVESAFYTVMLRLLEQGFDLILSGLAYDYRDLPFGSTLLFAGIAGPKCIWRTAHCGKCGSDNANHSQRIRGDGSIAPFTEAQEAVDDGKACRYEPRCDDCFVVLGRPVPKY